MFYCEQAAAAASPMNPCRLLATFAAGEELHPNQSINQSIVQSIIQSTTVSIETINLTLTILEQ